MSHRTLRVLFGLALSAATAGALAGSGTDPADYNAFCAPAYQIPDSGLMSPSAARGKDIFRSTYR